MVLKKIILDTNCYTAFLGGDEKVLQALSEAEIVLMSIFVLGELFAGFKGGNKTRENIALLTSFLAKPTVRPLDATQETAEIFGSLKTDLKKAGTPLPINDVWIAAHTMETGSVIVTYDKHFSCIPNLRMWPRLV